jgi:hypothetical protein
MGRSSSAGSIPRNQAQLTPLFPAPESEMNQEESPCCTAPGRSGQ